MCISLTPAGFTPIVRFIPLSAIFTQGCKTYEVERWSGCKTYEVEVSFLLVQPMFHRVHKLELGIEMCFFVGLDAYSRTWLQLVFPIYIDIILYVTTQLRRKPTIWGILPILSICTSLWLQSSALVIYEKFPNRTVFGEDKLINCTLSDLLEK